MEEEYRVIIDTMREQYLYHVSADSEQSAEEQGIENAKMDGMDQFDWFHVTVENA